jgi:Acetyltransferase (GNAT) domain
MSLPGPPERLVFREMTDDDLDPMADLLGDPDGMSFYAHPRDRTEALEWIRWNQQLYREHGSGLWLIELRDTGEFVGDCGLTPQDVDGTTEIEIATTSVVRSSAGATGRRPPRRRETSRGPSLGSVASSRSSIRTTWLPSA